MDDQAVIDRHQASKKRLKVVRVVGPLVMVLVVVIGIWSIVALFTNMDVDQLTRDLQSEAERVMPRVQENLMAAAQRVTPLVREEFAKAQKEMEPVVAKRFKAETDRLESNLKETLEVRLKEGLAKGQERRREALLKHFPELIGDVNAQNDVLQAGSDGASEWAMGQFTTSLNGHIGAMTKIRDTLNNGFGLGKPGSGQEPQDAMVAWLELFSDSVAGDDNVIADDGSGRPVDADGEKGSKKPAGKKKGDK